MQATCNKPKRRSPKGFEMGSIAAEGLHPGGPGTVPAAAHEGEVNAIDDEAVLCRHPLNKWLELAERHIDDAPAVLANQVMVLGHDRQVNHSGSMPRVDVMQVAALLQSVESSVHRRLVDRRPDPLLGPGLDLGGAEMGLGRFGEHFTDRAPGSSDAEPFVAKGRDEIVGNSRHAGIVPVLARAPGLL